jgi:hypothetical protein
MCDPSKGEYLPPKLCRRYEIRCLSAYGTEVSSSLPRAGLLPPPATASTGIRIAERVGRAPAAGPKGFNPARAKTKEKATNV